MILPRDLTLEQAHQEVSDLQEILDTHLEGAADALIHAEPCVDPNCPICGHDPCKIRQEPVQHQSIWHRESLTAPANESPHSPDTHHGGQSPHEGEQESKTDAGKEV